MNKNKTISEEISGNVSPKRQKELQWKNARLNEQSDENGSKKSLRASRKVLYWSIFSIAMVVLFGFDVLVAFGVFGPNIAQYSVLNLLFRGNTFEYGGVVYVQDTFLHYVLRAIFTVIVVWIILKIISIVFAILKKRASKRGRTIIAMVSSFIRYVGILIGLIAFVAVLGVNLGGLLAGAGVLAIVIGFGLQSIIADIFAGVFIVLEDNFDVGDIVTVNGFRGEVISVGIRTTRIKAFAGEDVMVINNNDLRSVINMSKHMSLAKVQVHIAHTESMDKVEKILDANLALIEEIIPEASELSFKGVTEFGPFGAQLLFIAVCEEIDRPKSERAMNRELKILFDNNNIKYSISQPDSKVPASSAKSSTATKIAKPKQATTTRKVATK